MPFPVYRPRRLRESPLLRSMVRETVLRADDFVYPLFAMHGRGIREPIGSMPLLAPSVSTNIHPETCVLGTIFVSMTLIQGFGLMLEKYSAAAFTSASLAAFPMASIVVGGPIFDSEVLRRPFL